MGRGLKFHNEYTCSATTAVGEIEPGIGMPQLKLCFAAHRFVLYLYDWIEKYKKLNPYFWGGTCL